MFESAQPNISVNKLRYFSNTTKAEDIFPNVSKNFIEYVKSAEIRKIYSKGNGVHIIYPF